MTIAKSKWARSWRAAGRNICLKGNPADIERAENELPKANSQLVDAIEAISEGFVLFDSDERLVICNAKYKQLHTIAAHMMVPGARFEDIIRTAAKDGQHPSAIGRIEEWVAERLAQFRNPGQSRDQELADGRWLHYSERKTRDGGTVGIRADITRLKKTEEALVKSETRFRDFATSASDWFWEMDESLRFSYFSRRFSEVTGVAESHLLGKTRQETGIPNVDEAAWEQHLADLAAHRPFRAFVHPRTNEFGAILWFSINGTPIFDGDGNFKGYRGTGSDITQQIHTESLLRESEQRLKAIMDHVPAALFLKDLDCRYLLTNRQYEEWFGISSAAAAGKTAHDLFPKEYADRHAIGDLRTDGDWRVTADEVNLPGSCGESRDFISTKFPIFDAGEATGFGGVMIDITKRKSAEEALRVSNQRLEAHHRRLRQELNTGRDMQAALLPSRSQFQSIEQKYLCRVESHFETSSELGGDFWGLREIDDHRLGIFLVDFSGHGVGAAMNTFRLHTLMSEMPPPDSPAAFLTELNGQLIELLSRGQFATMLYAIIDTRMHSITYSSAAALNPLIGYPDRKRSIFAESRGKPLGISARAVYTDRRLDFPAEAYLFLYSDALTEARVPDGGMFGSEALQSLLDGRPDPSGSIRVPEIVSQFKARVCLPLMDDLTTVCLQR